VVQKSTAVLTKITRRREFRYFQIVIAGQPVRIYGAQGHSHDPMAHEQFVYRTTTKHHQLTAPVMYPKV
jgi:hypothetical protein